jgi:hypothetical protein
MFRPDFIIVGAQKSGTTWLHSILSTCEKICLPKYVKELNYYNRNYEKGNVWYASQFEPVDKGVELFGEASPEYMVDRSCIERIARDCPDVKIIVMLRYPPSRSIAHFKHLVRTRNIARDFRTALQNFPEIEKWSRYSEQLPAIFEFFPRAHVKLLIFEELVAEPEAVVGDLLSFLNLIVCHGIAYDSLERNEFYLPRFPALYAALRKIGGRFSATRFKKIVSWMKGHVVRMIGRNSDSGIDIPMELKEKLGVELDSEIDYVKSLLGRTPTNWINEYRK